LGLYCERQVCHVYLHRNLNRVVYVIIRVLHSFRNITHLRHVLSAFVCDGKISFIVEVWFLL